jgi:hypothetical protein
LEDFRERRSMISVEEDPAVRQAMSDGYFRKNRTLRLHWPGGLLDNSEL